MHFIKHLQNKSFNLQFDCDCDDGELQKYKTKVLIPENYSLRGLMKFIYSRIVHGSLRITPFLYCFLNFVASVLRIKLPRKCILKRYL